MKNRVFTILKVEEVKSRFPDSVKEFKITFHDSKYNSKETYYYSLGAIMQYISNDQQPGAEIYAFIKKNHPEYLI